MTHIRSERSKSQSLHLSKFSIIYAIFCLLSACGGMEWSAPGYGTHSQKYIPIAKQNAAFVNARTIIVGKGDTVYALSRRYQISERDIIISNNLQAPYHLLIGQRIIIPRGYEHTVAKGDTLYALSRVYKINVYDLARANGLKSPYTIFIGQKLRLPNILENAITNNSSTIGVTATPSKIETQITTTPENLSISGGAPTTQIPALTKPNLVESSTTLATSKGFIWPVKGKIISNFGAKEKGLHNDGVNISAPAGSPVKAAENGVVAYAGNELRGFGNLLLLKHSNGYVTAYAHNSKLLVQRGDKVKKGQLVATVGKTGTVTRPQLHFEVRKGKKAVDPLIIMPDLNA